MENKGKIGWRTWFLLAILLFAGLLKLYSLRPQKMFIAIDEAKAEVLVVKDFARLAKGLGGRKDLGKYDGMLFVFYRREQHAMVMRNMLMPIDIIWIDDGEVVDIAPNVQTEHGKTEGEYIRYSARKFSTHVLETRAGWTAEKEIKIGDKVRINTADVDF